LPETFRLMTSSDGWFSESNQGFTLSPCKRSQGQALATLLRAAVLLKASLQIQRP
jgi:hypothetical protein